MTTTLLQYVRADQRDQTFVTECATEATALVLTRVTGAPVPEENPPTIEETAAATGIPAAVLHKAILEVGANLYQRRVSAIGRPGYTDPETMGNPHRPALDPLTPAWPLLRPYLRPGIA